MADEATKGYGQQGPSDSIGPFNPFAFQIAQALARISTNKIVKVMAVDTGKKTVDVQIAVNQLDGQLNSTPHGTIYGIPYVWAMGGTNAFMVDPAVGDLGVMVVSDRDISAVKNTKDIANPGSLRKFSPSDGMYLFGIPGLNGSDPEQWVKFTDTGLELHDKNGNALVSGSTGWAFTGVVTFNDNVQFAGQILGGTGGELAVDIKTTGDVVAGAISVKGHHHTAQGATAPTTVAQP